MTRVAPLAIVTLLVSCGANHSVPEPSPDPSAAAQCAALMRALPDEVADQELSTRTALTAQWGDPAIRLRCGVQPPAELKPTSRCDLLNDVGWFTIEEPAEYRFFTIGRATTVEVTVPSDHAPQADALIDLSTAVKQVAELRPCQ